MIIGYHLICDCKKATRAFSCPTRINPPTIETDNRYYYCSYCRNDYTCEQAIKKQHIFDDNGILIGHEKLCIKCNTKLVEKEWPTEYEFLKTYTSKEEAIEEIKTYS